MVRLFFFVPIKWVTGHTIKLRHTRNLKKEYPENLNLGGCMTNTDSFLMYTFSFKEINSENIFRSPVQNP
jgi:hypothetical protein